MHTETTLGRVRRAADACMNGKGRAVCSGWAFTDLVIGDEGNTVVDSQSANEEVILQVASVVIGQVYHQVNMALADQSIKRCNNR